MIICFTGTGNSKRVALHMQEVLDDEIVRLPPGHMVHPENAVLNVTDGRVIWVFPVFGWNLPIIVNNVLAKIKLVSDTPLVHHMVVTCGDDIGYVDTKWRKHIEARKEKVGSVFSVQMPNTYTFMRGFDIDSEDVIEAKLQAEPARSEYIARTIKDSETPVVDVTRGSFPWIKTNVLGKWFYRYKMSIKPFHTTDACSGCGRCVRNCPANTIRLENKRPVWSGLCTMCLRCYHCCPNNAVRYGKASDDKGQYMCPGYTLKP